MLMLSVEALVCLKQKLFLIMDYNKCGTVNKLDINYIQYKYIQFPPFSPPLHATEYVFSS